MNSHVIAGNIIAKLGVKYLYIISFAVMTPFLIAIYWFVWETSYPRPDPLEVHGNLERRNSEEPASPSSPSSERDSLGNDLPDDIKKTKIVVETTEDIRNISTTTTAESFHPPTTGT